MSQWDDYLARQSEANIIEPDHPCRKCSHRFDQHGEFICLWRDGEDFCLCGGFEMAELSDLRDEEEDRRDEQ